jgi:D-glycero-beta-D-manno-heptose 1-phosphate adenylyltransferase
VLQCHPDVIVKGGDYDVATTVGAAEVRAWGGRFESIPLLAGRSTSALLEKIRR